MSVTITGSGITYNDATSQTVALKPLLDQNSSTTATSYQVGTHILVAQIQSLISATQPPVTLYNTAYSGSLYIIPWPTMYFNVSYGGSPTYTSVTSVTGFCTHTSSSRLFSATGTTYTALAGTWVSRGYLGDSNAPNTAYCLYQLFQRIS
jgi:hypothetical protein